jgi:hypothetical protein
MKKIILPILLSFSFAATANEGIKASDKEMKIKADMQVISGGKEFVWKSSTSCSTKGSGKDVVYPSRKATSYYVCPDSTVSHSQPASTGYNGWEGYCGQTSISNITSMLCTRHIDPKSNDYYGTDYTPGEHSSTMKTSLRKIFAEHPKTNTCPKVTWNVRKNWSGSSFLKSVKGDLFGSTKKIRRFRTTTTYVEVTPTPVLINSGGLNYHWVTVVDIISNKKDGHGCDVVVNTWGDQKTLTCDNFVSYADHSSIGEHVSIGFD